MAVTKYFENGSEFWQVYVNIRSAQKRRNPFDSPSKAHSRDRHRKSRSPKKISKKKKRLLAELTRQITKLEARGETWDQLIAKYSGVGSKAVVVVGQQGRIAPPEARETV